LTLPPLDLLLPILSIAFLAGLVQGLSGFGSGLVAAPLLALLLPLETAVPLMTLLSPLISLQNLLHLRQAIRFDRVRVLLAGYVVGTPLGLYLLTRAPATLMLGVLGVFLTGYALVSLTGRQPRARWLREWRFSLGVASGALGSAYSTSGPPVILHVAAHPEWEPDQQKATLALFLGLSNLITLAAFGLSGLYTGEIFGWFLWAFPLLALGTQAGILLYRRMGAHDYRRLTFGLILAMGIILLWRAIALNP
jgi:uncharacterized membrane protein YfcA